MAGQHTSHTASVVESTAEYLVYHAMRTDPIGEPFRILKLVSMVPNDCHDGPGFFERP